MDEFIEIEKIFGDQTRAIFEANVDMIYLMSITDGTYKYVNQAALAIFGYSQNEFYSNPLLIKSIVHPDFHNYFQEKWRDLQEGKIDNTYIYKIIDSEGNERWIQQTNQLIHRDDLKHIYIFGICRNITDQVLKEAKLQETQILLKAAIEQNPIPIVIASANDFIVRYLNPSVERILGIEDEASKINTSLLDLKATWQDYYSDGTFVPPDQTPIIRALKGEKIVNKKMYILRKDGTIRWEVVSASPIYNNEGDIIAGIVAFPDITEIHLAEQRFYSVLEVIPAFVYLKSKDYHIKYANQEFKKIFGSELSLPCYKLIKGIDHPCKYCPTDRVFKTGKSQQGEWTHPDGRVFMMYYSLLPDSDGTPMVVEVGVDITKIKKLENERIRAQKIKSISLLAGGIAHDFNNILVGILGNVNLLQLDDNFTEEQETTMHDMELAVFRAKELSQQLLTFSKGGSPEKSVSDLEKLIREAVSMVSRGKKNKTVLNFADNLPRVNIDYGQITQVITNIVLNSIQASVEQGIIEITTKNISLDEECGIPLPIGDYIKIDIKDNGIGIQEEDKAQIFDLYYSTKSDGNGLGLPICYSIIQRHEGHITFNSKIGVGTTFSIFLPIYLGELELNDKKDQSSSNILKSSQNSYVLLLDDDPIIRKTITKMLNRLEYHVKSFSHGEELLKYYKQERQEKSPLNIDAIILDLTIPGGLGGKEIIDQLRALDPDQYIIVSSGYSNDPILINYKKYGFDIALKKPFTFLELKNVFLQRPQIKK